MSILGNRVLGGAGQQTYQVGRSLRLRRSAGAFLNRTPSVASNRTTWTWSGWVKRGLISSGSQRFFSSYAAVGTAQFLIRFNSTDTITIEFGNASPLATTAVFRDPSAWYHIVMVADTTQATNTNRIKLYVNGVQQTLSGTYPVQNFTTYINDTQPNFIGGDTLTTEYFDGFLGEVNFIDGQALTPSSFGAYDNNGVWQPIKYAGTYGTNGFYLPFSDTTSTTTLCYDKSGNGNNWTPNNISLVYGTSRYLGSISGSIDLVNGGPPASMFKGSTAQPGPYPQPGATLTWNPYASVSFSSTARVYIGVDVNGPATGLVVNSTNFGNGGIAGNAFGWVNVASAGSPITSISWSRASGGSQGMRVFAVEIDGVILIDGPSWNPLYDSMIDSPTVSASASNYCTLNPLDSAGGVISDGNLSATQTATGRKKSTIGVSSGKWYWEVIAKSSGDLMIGASSVTLPAAGAIVGSAANDYGYYSTNGQKYTNGTTAAYGSTYTTNDVIGVALDLNAATITFYKNNISQGTAYTGISGTLTPAVSSGGAAGASFAINLGQQPFTYTPPSGYNALNTYNLPPATIPNGALYMAASTWSGDAATTRTLTNNTNNTTGVIFQPDFVWLKARNLAYSNLLYDFIRGPSNGTVSKSLVSNATIAEGSSNDDTTNGYLSAFNSNGFSVVRGTSSPASYTNGSGYTYVGWQWNAGSGTTSTNTNGSITSLVSVNPTAGFSIVSYTGTGANATVGHGLGVAPSMFIIKNRTTGSAGYNWCTYHQALGNTKGVFLNLTDAQSTDSTLWNNTSPTSSVFSIGTSGALNQSTANMVAYCWSAVAGYSAFGSYTGNGSADGPFIYTGFRPRWVMVKCSSAVENWYILDSSRNNYNPENDYLLANSSGAEANYNSLFDFLSNGFKIRGAAGANNTNAATYVYAAFAENPFNNSRAR